MTCPDCNKWKQQAQANVQTILLQAEMIKGMKTAIKEIVNALVGR